jgi:cadmium resistance protein CadD (predicted permease)
MSVLPLVSLAAVVFASTNIDGIFVLVGFFSDPKIHHWHVVTGQILGIGALIAISVAAAFTALAISSAYIGLLGLAPLAIGLKKLSGLRSVAAGVDGVARNHREGRHGNTLTVAAVTISNGGDNIGAYTPLFATQTGREMSVTITVFSVLTLVWCLVAWLLVNHPSIGKPIRRYGRIALPFALIILGGLILYRSGAIDLLAGLAT